MTLNLQDSLFSASLAVYLTASVFVAAVRWGHRCQPYGKHMDYYHPAQEESALSEGRQDEIEKAIRRFVEQDQAYLDSHLLLDDVASRIGVNSKYVSLVMKSRLGGFFSYINRCRLSHAARLQVEHPEMPIGEVIADSGFGSRSTYYSALAKLRPKSHDA